MKTVLFFFVLLLSPFFVLGSDTITDMSKLRIPYISVYKPDTYNPSGDYYIPGGQGYSTNMFDALIGFMEEYGQDGIQINITG
jgi:hypothetical protein